MQALENSKITKSAYRVMKKNTKIIAKSQD